MHKIFALLKGVYSKFVRISPLNYIKIRKLKKIQPLKLNIGCGNVKFPDWVNIDIEPGADLVIDVTKGLPFDDDTVDYIFNEHFIEHLDYGEGQKILREFYRVLKKDGILRIATPDLDYIVEKYSTDWKNQDWLSWPEYQFIETKGQMINVSFRFWGHKYLYNEEDIKNSLKKSRFKKVSICKLQESNHFELENRETRNDSTLIYEATK
jgi:predicted SAM-dependent methyltransferase